MTSSNRPTSPHLSAYRWRISSGLSILHRLSGVVLSLGAVILVAGMLSLASGSGAFEQFAGVLTSVPGKIVLFGWLTAFFYHFCNGIRHLFWDAGKGFELQTARNSGKAVLLATLVLTLITWFAF